MLTNKQNQLLSFLIKRIEQDGVSPSYEEICIELNLKSKSGVHRIVKGLEERGYIEHLENKARAIAPTKHPNGQLYISNVININRLLHPKDRIYIETSNQDIKKIPMLGKIAAGTPIEAIQNEVSRIPLPSNLEKNGDYFGLKVQGDSMIEAGIHEGDTVIIKRTDTADNGKIVVALIDEHEAMLKRIRKKGKVVALESANKNYETKIFGPDRIKVQGVLVSLYRNF